MTVAGDWLTSIPTTYVMLCYWSKLYRETK